MTISHQWIDLLRLKLPKQDAFKNKLTTQSISDKDYNRARHLLKLFNCESLENYLNIYLKVDLVLLVDIFEKFRRMCMETYKLDPTYYFSAPCLTFDAALKMAGFQLELLLICICS